MPEINVQDEQGNTHVFPDGSTPEMIAKAMGVATPAPAAPPVHAQPSGPVLGNYLDSALEGVKSTADDLYTGGVKKFGQGIATISSALNKIPRVGETLAPKVGVDSFQQQMQPDNTTQKIGGALEQAGEMALTGGPLKAGAESIASRLPFLGRFVTPAARVGAEALNVGGNAALHGEPVGPSAAIGAGGATIAEGLPLMTKMLKNAAIKQYTRALAPTTKQTKTIAQDVVPELIARGERGSLDGLENTATKNIQTLTPQLDSEYSQLQQASPKLPVRNPQTGQMARGTQGQIPASGNKVISDLETLKRTYMPGGKVAQPQAVNAINGVQDIVRQYGPNVSPTNLRRLRQIFEEVPAQRGAYAGADLSTNYTLRAQQAAADSIRSILNNSKSDIGSLNKEVSFWLDVQRVTRESALRQTGQQGGLLKVLSPLATGGTASLTGLHFGAEKGIEAALATAMSTAAYQATRSPVWRTTSAVLKDRLASAMATGSAAEVLKTLARISAASQGSAKRPTRSDPRTSQGQGTQVQSQR